MNSMKIKKGDTVVVLTGKDKGKQRAARQEVHEDRVSGTRDAVGEVC